MLVTARLLASGFSTTELQTGQTFQSASFVPSPNKLLLVCTASDGNNNPFTLAGNNVTYVQEDTQANGISVRATVYRAMGASPQTGPITFTAVGHEQPTAYAVLELDVVDTTGADGAGAVRQSVPGSASAALAISIALGAFGGSDNATIGVFALNKNTTSVVPGSGFTGLAAVTPSTSPARALFVEFRSDNSTSVGASFSQSSNWAGIALEIKAAPAPPTGGSMKMSAATGDWHVGGTWVGGVAPTATDVAVVDVGHTVTLADRTPVCKRPVVLGKLRAHRTANVALLAKGSIVNMGGEIDLGKPGDICTGSVDIDFLANEVNLQGAAPFASTAGVPSPMPDPMDAATFDATAGANAIYNTDVGFWVMNGGILRAQGIKRDTWTKLNATAASGQNTIVVKGFWTDGWAVGDTLVVAPSNFKTSAASQAERARIKTISGSPGDATRTITLKNLGDELDYNLVYAHTVAAGTPRQWTDFYTDIWQEVLAPAVGNLTSNVRFRATDGNNTYASRATVNDNRPHLMVMDTAHTFLSDLEIMNFSPLVHTGLGLKAMGRYGLHWHRQFANSVGSYADRVRIHGDVGVANGWGVSVHEAHSLVLTDLLLVGMGTSAATGTESPTAAVVLEDTITIEPPLGGFQNADKCRILRPCIITSGATNHPIPGSVTGFWFGNGVTAATDGVVVGLYVCDVNGSSGVSSGVTWPLFQASLVGGVNRENESDKIPAYRVESHSNYAEGLRTATNEPIFPSGIIDIVDASLWSNTFGGEEHGRYNSGWWKFCFRMIGNGEFGSFHSTAGRGLTNFLNDSQDIQNTPDAGPVTSRTDADGILVKRYIVASTAGTRKRDSVYEAGVVRNVHATRKGLFASSAGVNASAVLRVQFADVNLNNAAIQYSEDTFPVGSHPLEGFPPFHDVSPIVCTPDNTGNFGDSSAFLIRRGVNVPHANVDIFHLNDDNIGGATADTTYGALAKRIISSANARIVTPRVKLTTSPDDGRTVASDRLITGTIVVDTSCMVELYDAAKSFKVEIQSWPQSLVASLGGILTFTYDTSTSTLPYAALVAEAVKDSNGDGVPDAHPSYTLTSGTQMSGNDLEVRNYSRVNIIRTVSAGGPPPEPTNPTFTSIVATMQSLVLGTLAYTWLDGPNETLYKCYFKKSTDSVYSLATTAGVNATTATASNLPLLPNTLYDTYMAAVGSSTQEYPSNVRQVLTPQVAPAIMTGANVENVGTTTADMFALDGSTNEDGFDARWRNEDTLGAWNDLAPDKAAAAGTGTKIVWNLASLPMNTNIRGEMWAKNSAGDGPSATVLFKTGTTPPEPGSPTLDSFTSPAPTTVTAAFTPADSNAAGYILQTSPDGVAGWVTRAQMGAVGPFTLSWTAAIASQTYYGRIGALGSGINIFFSSSLSVTTGVAAPIAPNQISITDVLVQGADGVQVTLSVVDQSGGTVGSEETGFKARYKRDEAGGTYVDLTPAAGASGIGSTISWLVPALLFAKPYLFEVWASNLAGDSSVISTTFLTPPATILTSEAAGPFINVVKIQNRARTGRNRYWDRIHGLGGF